MEIIYFRKHFKIYLAEFSKENPNRWSLWAYSIDRNDCYLLGARNEEGKVEEAYNIRNYPWDVQTYGRRLFAEVGYKVEIKSTRWYRVRMMKMGRPQNTVLRLRARKLREQGMRYRDIEKVLHRDISLLHRWCKDIVVLSTPPSSMLLTKVSK